MELSQKEIIEDNKKIATFMGAKNKSEMSFPSVNYMENYNLWIPIHGICRWDTIETGKGRTLQYHSSWDWLMPVVEKIESLKDPVTEQLYKIRINQGFFTEIFVASGDEDDFHISKSGKTRIISVYKAVLEFIDWYNKQKES